MDAIRDILLGLTEAACEPPRPRVGGTTKTGRRVDGRWGDARELTLLKPINVDAPSRLRVNTVTVDLSLPQVARSVCRGARLRACWTCLPGELPHPDLTTHQGV